MKKLVAAIPLSLALGLSALTLSHTASASNSRHFVSTIQIGSAPIKVNVVLGEDLAYRADHVSKNMRDRSGPGSSHNGWSGQGKYGQKELDKLTIRLKKKMEAQLARNGVAISDSAVNVLNIVITDARPSRPTFEQMSQPGLSYQSFALGGAKFEGSMTTSGQEAGAISYAWYERDIQDAQYGGTWTDAYRAIDRFARKTAKAVK